MPSSSGAFRRMLAIVFSGFGLSMAHQDTPTSFDTGLGPCHAIPERSVFSSGNHQKVSCFPMLTYWTLRVPSE